jgi:N-acyl-D-amino-acid deacylase
MRAPTLLAVICLLLTGCVDPNLQDETAGGGSGTTIVGATVIDGTGAPPVATAVRIVGDRIEAIGDLTPHPADTVIDATGLVLAPGFIDTHSHADDDILQHPDARAAVNQGVTTMVGGADGFSHHPLAEFFATLEATPIAVNLASFAGHNTYRDRVMGEDFRRAATDQEVDAMKPLLEEDLAAGALGLSTGLEYDPGIYSTPEEVVALSKVAAAYGGRYTSHLRSEDRYFWEAVDEILNIGRQADIPVNITHIKLAMQSSHGEAEQLLARLDAARAEGVEVTADIYPYTYWQSTLEVLFPERDFDNPESARFAVTEVSTPAGMLIAHFAPEPDLAGKTLEEIAAGRDTEPATTLMDLIREAQEYRDETGEESVESVIAVSMTEEDLDHLLRWPWANICTDGELWGSHPRGFGSFTRVLGHYVRERQTLTLEEAIHKMTGRAAATIGLTGRGRIAFGLPADLVLFDPLTVTDRATTDDPHRDSAGIHKVWVNGELVWDEGEITEARPGRVLRRPSA